MIEVSELLVSEKLPKLLPTDNKYSVGTLLCITGSDKMTGAAILCAKGALYCGTGLLYQSSPPHALDILQSVLFEPVFVNNELKELLPFIKKAKAIVFGCGIEENSNNAKILEYILNECYCPTVIDATGISLLKHSGLLSKVGENTILTPHEGEMKLLTGEFPSDRKKAAELFCSEYKATLVLKGHQTLIGQGDSLFVNLTGNAGMAKGGYGDLLAGMIGAFLSQGLSPVDAALTGVYLHGLAGDITSDKYTKHSALPSLCAELIPEALKRMYK